VGGGERRGEERRGGAAAKQGTAKAIVVDDDEDDERVDIEEAGPASVDGLEVEGVIRCPERILKTRLSAAAAGRREYFVKWMGMPIVKSTAAFSRKHSSMVAVFEAKFP
jgi:hypothetical protein